MFSESAKAYFLIVVESLNVTLESKPFRCCLYTFFKSLKFNSVVVDPFYGNSIQTASILHYFFHDSVVKRKSVRKVF